MRRAHKKPNNTKLQKIVLYSAIFLTGLLVGGVAGYGLAKQSINQENEQTRSYAKTDSNSHQDDKQQNAERLKMAYDMSKAQINRELKNGRLNKSQADKLTMKIDEINNYLKNIDRDSSSAQQELREKRAQWRAWADENDVSYRYLIRMN